MNLAPRPHLIPALKSRMYELVPAFFVVTVVVSLATRPLRMWRG